MNHIPKDLFNSVSSPAKKRHNAFIETMYIYIYIYLGSFRYFIEQFIAFVTKKPMHNKNEDLEYARLPIIFGLAVMFVFFY